MSIELKDFNKYKIALIQMESKFMDVDANIKKAVAYLEEAVKNGAKLVCFPEGFLTGYYADCLSEIVELAEKKEQHSIGIFFEFARKYEIYILVPCFCKIDDKVKNSAILIDKTGKMVGSYSKTHLINAEQETITRGEEFPVWDTELGKIGCLICYDICFPETARIMALKGAEILLVPSAWRGSLYFTRWWDLNIECRALDNLLYVAAINQIGNCGKEFFAGKSKLCDPTGAVISECSETEEKIIYGEIDLNRIKYERQINTVLEDMQNDLYEIERNL